MAEVEAAALSISVGLVIDPPAYSLQAGESTIPSLFITATLAPTAPKPVTILTWPTIFNPSLALRRRNFTAQNISPDPPATINLEITKGSKRPGFRRRKSTRDEKYYVTLFSGQELTVADYPLNIVKRTSRDGETHIFEPGNTYSLCISDEGREVRTWWWGTMDEVLDEVGGPLKDVSGLKGSESVFLTAEPAYFRILG